MALFEIKNNFDGTAVNKILGFFKELLNQPNWLLITVVLAICGTGAYFWYSSQSEKESISLLLELVILINEVVNENLNIVEYKENLIYVITEIKLLEMALQLNYDERLYEVDCFIEFAEKYHPNDPIVLNYKSMKLRMEVNYEIYNQHYKYVMVLLNKIVQDGVQ